jgi:hypothetical protein
MGPMIVQMGAFNTYWESLYHILKELNSNARNASHNLGNNNNFSDQIRAILNGPMKDKWKQVKTQCDNYAKTVRRLISETQNP